MVGLDAHRSNHRSLGRAVVVLLRRVARLGCLEGRRRTSWPRAAPAAIWLQTPARRQALRQGAPRPMPRTAAAAGNTKRARTNALTPLTRTILWAKAGGRCQYAGCNKLLIGDLISGAEDKNFGFAHRTAR